MSVQDQQTTQLPGMPQPQAQAAVSNPKRDINALNTLEQHLYAHRYAQTMMGCFGPSIDPADATLDRAEAQAVFEEEDNELLCSPQTGAMLDRLAAQPEILSDTQKAQVKILQRRRSELVDVPVEIQTAFTKLTTKSDAVWRKAKVASDWDSFEPYLDKIIESMKTIAGYKNPNADVYDVWLDTFEHGSNRAFYDTYFEQVKACVVPLLAEITKRGWQPDRSMFEGRFDAERQWNLSHDLMVLEGLNPNRVLLTKTEHPYSDGLTTNYAVIATHIYENDVLSNVFSMLHEGGHALYECGTNPAYNYTCLKGGTSMGMHEAQSRFFENLVGRSRAFAPILLKTMARHFQGQLGRVTPNQFYQAANRAEGSLVRTEADELTYSLHIIIRYELEQMLFAGECTAHDIPALWAQKYKSYLGVDVPDHRHGALQDSHWAGGMIGYFPTYALGSAYGAQLRHAMIAQGMDFEGVLASGDLAPIRAWLTQNIWQWGSAKDPDELIKAACGEPFSAHYFTDYLTNKFSALYGLDK